MLTLLVRHTYVLYTFDIIKGVEIVPTLKRKGEEDALILLWNYRPPIGSFILEFPAGMLDPAEEAGTAAVRELLEETGYTGKVTRVTSSVVRFSQAVSSTTSRIAFVEVDGDAEVNRKPVPKPGKEELCKTVVVPVSKLLQTLDSYSQKDGSVDGKVYFLAAGFANLQNFK